MIYALFSCLILGDRYFVHNWFVLTNILKEFVFHMPVLVATICTVAKLWICKRIYYIVGFTAQTHAIGTKWISGLTCVSGAPPGVAQILGLSRMDLGSRGSEFTPSRAAKTWDSVGGTIWAAPHDGTLPGVGHGTG